MFNIDYKIWRNHKTQSIYAIPNIPRHTNPDINGNLRMHEASKTFNNREIKYTAHVTSILVPVSSAQEIQIKPIAVNYGHWQAATVAMSPSSPW